MKRSAAQSGYVLIVTLVIIVMSGVLLASTARISMEHAAQARRSEQDLQRRWGMISIRQLMLPNASTFLANAYDRAKLSYESRGKQLAGRGISPGSPPQFQRSIQLPFMLGRMRFSVLLRDESARVNINRIYDQTASMDQTRRIISAISGAASAGLKLAPVAGFAVGQFNQEDRRAFNHFSQVFSDASPERLIGPLHEDDGLIAHLTCWGSGRLNIQRCSPAALRAVLLTVLDSDTVGRILALRAENPELKLGEYLMKARAPANIFGWSQETLTDQSDCYSVWIMAGAGRRTWHQWAIREPSPTGSHTMEFAW